MPTYTYTPEDVFNMIVKENIKTKFKVSLVVVAGLPGSGKSTLVDKLTPYRRNNREMFPTADMPELRLREVGYCSTTRQESLAPIWGQYTWDDIYIYTLARALLAKRNAMPQLKEWAHVERLPKELLENKGLLDHFRNLYDKMQKGLANVGIDRESEFRFHLMSEPSYVLLHMWDIGLTKSLNLSLPLIARLMNPFVLINVLDLYRDGLKKLRQRPEKAIKAHKDQHVMENRSRGHYICRECGLCKNKGESILIATHSDKVERDVGRVARLTEAGIRAKAGDVGVKGLREMLAVNLNDEKDCDCIKKSIVELMESTDAFDVHLPLTWIFLHSAILHYKSEKSDFRMSKSDFEALSSHCGIKSTEDVEKCLKFFTRIGSIMYSREFFGDEIIYHPRNFFKKLHKLYSSVEAADKHRKESTSRGILCKRVAEDIWCEDKEFFWHLMQKAGVATPTKVLPRPYNPKGHYDYNMHCPFPECRETELLFVSTLRIERLPRKEHIGEDSLFITFNTEYIPADIQTVLVKYLKIAIPELKLKLTKHYNFTEFELPEDGHFRVTVHGDVVELAVTGYDNHEKDREIKRIIRSTCITVLEKVLAFFPGCQYQLGLLCKECLKLSSTDPAPNNNITSYLTFLPSQYETDHLYCRDYFHSRLVQDENGEEFERHKCNKMIELSSAQLRWMTLTGRVSYAQYCRLLQESSLRLNAIIMAKVYSHSLVTQK